MLRKLPVRQSFFGHGLLLLLPVAAPAVKVSYVSAETSVDRPLPVRPSVNAAFVAATFDSKAVKKAAAAGIQLNKSAFRLATAYVKKESEFLQKMAGKKVAYFSKIEDVFARYQLPHQLKYLAIVESELRATARSRVGARGLWQLMPETAGEMGLKVSARLDERINTGRSTVAAAKYLKALYAEFGDWLLVLAAYNGGPGTVYKAIRKAGSRNFWRLQRFLPAESRGHVLRFISIHYFFEGAGSVATQTKAEAKEYRESLGGEEVSGE